MLTEEQIDEVSLVSKNGILDRISRRARAHIHEKFMQIVRPSSHDSILDVGASAKPALMSSNYLEWANPELSITAVGLGKENPLWKKHYPFVPYIHGNALDLPFPDKSFDIVYSHAVIEHAGNFENQIKMIAEALRVARKTVWMTTPNRWHPVEFHTVLPLIHWLPKPLHRYFLKKIGLNYFSSEDTLNLLDQKTLRLAVNKAKFFMPEKMTADIHSSRFLGFCGNLLLHVSMR